MSEENQKIQWGPIDLVQKAFYEVKWSKLEAFSDISELIQNKNTMLSRKGVFSRLIFTHN